VESAARQILIELIGRVPSGVRQLVPESSRKAVVKRLFKG
jgi:hypothetical protein